MNPPNVFVISIRRLSHRIEIFKRNNPDLAFEVLYGFDSKDPKNQSALNRFSKEYRKNPSEISVLISHRLAWQHMIEQKIEKAFFFEDDVVLSSKAKALLEATNIPDKFQCIKLETYNTNVFFCKRFEHEINGIYLHKVLSGSGYGSAGYYLTISMARILIESTKDANIPIDHLMFGALSIPVKLGMVFQLIPAICIQEEHLAIRQNRSSAIQSEISFYLDRLQRYPEHLIFLYKILKKIKLLNVYRVLKFFFYIFLAFIRNKNLSFKKMCIPFLE